MDVQAVGQFLSGQMFSDRVFAADQHQLAILISLEKAQRGRYDDTGTVVTAHGIERNRDFLSHAFVRIAANSGLRAKDALALLVNDFATAIETIGADIVAQMGLA